MGSYIESIHRVVTDNEPDCYIEVREDADGLGLVKVHTSETGQLYWGVCSMIMNRETTIALIEALQNSLDYAK